MVVTHFDKLMAESKAEGMTEGSLMSARNLIKLGKLTNEEIAEATGLPIEKIRELADPRSA